MQFVPRLLQRLDWIQLHFLKPIKAQTVSEKEGALPRWWFWRHWACGDWQQWKHHHQLPLLLPCSCWPAHKRGGTHLPPSLGACWALPGKQQIGRRISRVCKMHIKVYTRWFCAMSLVWKDDTFCTESLVTITQGILYFFWAAPGIYKRSFQVRCQNDLHLCNPRWSEGIQKINLGIFSSRPLLKRLRRDSEVCQTL